ncbi:MAG: ATP-binding protein [Candidatus Pacebacteria bacterium]|nr:ATP-binding protein [Candidatus Paceibacterota bacterium]
MKINLKLALISAVIFALLAVISGVIMSKVIYPSFTKVQNEQNLRDAQRLRSLLFSEMESLDHSADNWSKSDSLVKISETSRPERAMDITPSMLRDVGADIVLIIDAKGQVIRSIYYLKSGKQFIVTIPKTLQDLLVPIARRTLYGEEHFGFLPCTNRLCDSNTVVEGEDYHIPIMLSVRKILPSDRSGDVRGVLLMGRQITPAVLGRFQNELGLKFFLQPASPEFFENRGDSLLRLVPNNNQVTVIQPLPDINGNQTIEAIMNISRRITELGYRSVIFAVAAITTTALLVIAALWLMLRLQVVNPLRILTTQVLGVRSGILRPAESQPYLKLERRDDEIGVLAKELSQMLVRLDEMVARIDESRQVAETAYEAKSQFLAVITQDLRAPLTSIMRLAEEIRSQPDGNIQQCKDNAREINNASRQLLTLVNDMLDLANTQAENFQIIDEQVNLVDLIQQSVRSLQAALTTAGIVLQLEFPADFPQLRGDVDRLRQVVLNLLRNAQKFSLPGGKILVKGEVSGEGAIILTVSDQGIGIDAQNIERLLSPIKINDSDIARRFMGTGLGLSIAKRLTEAHGGTMRIESEQGQGTRVTVTLPAERVIR